MGFETANVHLGDGHANRLMRAAKAITLSEFTAAMRSLEKSVMGDWKDWRRR
jgi:hypothetical protein